MRGREIGVLSRVAGYQNERAGARGRDGGADSGERFTLRAADWSLWKSRQVRELPAHERVVLHEACLAFDEAKGDKYPEVVVTLEHRRVAPGMHRRLWSGHQDGNRKPYPGAVRSLAEKGFLDIVDEGQGKRGFRVRLSERWKSGETDLQGELVPIGYKSSEGTCTHSAPNLYPVERELVPIRGGNLYPMGTTLKEERNGLKSRKRESADRDRESWGKGREEADRNPVAIGSLIGRATGACFRPETPENLGEEIAELTGEGPGHAAMYAEALRRLEAAPGGTPRVVDEAIAHLRNCSNPATRAAKAVGVMQSPGKWITWKLAEACKVAGVRFPRPPESARVAR